MLRIFLTFLLFFCLSSISNARTINWLAHDFAPYYILNGQYQYLGRDESIISLLEKQLPNITFNRMLIPSGKVIQELSNTSNNVCALSLYKNDYRKEHIYFTDESSTTGLSPSIAMHKKLAKALNIAESKEVSLLNLIQDKKLTLGVSMSRSYGQEIDTLINSTPNIDLVIRPTRDSLASLTYMLNLKRIDILLGYPSEHYYLAKSMHFEENLTQRPLTESPALSYGFIGCTKNEQGAKDIAILNEQLKIIKKTQAYNDLLMRWLPEDLRPLLKSRINSTK
ncbi:transporter substrate-binding domain-containing protein [Pseudoalteromonas sp. SR43-6]|uniref:transporter substrate-binding domain-containing protein n=1 Tax=unclassified Pseudoalteromonas TaxID=194690 RepID=UPI0015FB2C01|nr:MULTISPECIES: transporter substrate-binding domain-containing protein [unclassified Pseudoalteromonas]MBB1288019.1 transporter substrate-binding domain-containing protein [Pseudoalteromonas sp. SR41-5]MBB1372851.1 transporter substrate-binding domain-containing protein [Pseudoalteromonas sp. SR43-6]MBB1412660.1 transporter substrate-binding domain-containing protein [Pseudoalteromonas sp. SG43-8]